MSLYLTEQFRSWLSTTFVFSSKYWRRITCDYVPSKFTSCVTARTRAIDLSPSKYRVTCMAEGDRNKHYILLDLPSLYSLILNPLTWKIWWAPNNASRWQMGFNSAFKGLKWSQLCLFYDCQAYDVSNKTELHAICSYLELTPLAVCEGVSPLNDRPGYLNFCAYFMTNVSTIWREKDKIIKKAFCGQ